MQFVGEGLMLMRDCHRDRVFQEVSIILVPLLWRTYILLLLNSKGEAAWTVS
jgi:hypothetical protein